jgi:nitrite reductase (NADH) small subunit
LEGFVKVAKEGELPEGGAMPVRVGERSIALFNVGGKYYATENTCQHLGGPLGEGSLKGSVVTCPWHSWQYDVRTGASFQSVSLFLKVFTVRVEGGEIYVATQATKPGAPQTP